MRTSLHMERAKEDQVAEEGDRRRHRPPPSSSTADLQFRPSRHVKGLRFGLQGFIVRSFTIRRSAPLELLRLLELPSTSTSLPTVTSYLPTGFTILAHQTLRTLTLGLGTRNSKVVIFVFESGSMRDDAEGRWPHQITLGEVNGRMIRGLPDRELARFKFKKGALTFYVYAVRPSGAVGFARVEDLRTVLGAVARLKEFLDHTAMLAMPNRRTIAFEDEAEASTAAGGDPGVD